MSGATQMSNFATLVKRLEFATTRLEEMTAFIGDVSLPRPSDAAKDPARHGGTSGHQNATGDNKAAKEAGLTDQSVLEDLEVVQGEASSAADDHSSLPKAIKEFDDIIDGQVELFVAISEQIGSPISEQCKAFSKAIHAVRTYIFVSLKAKKPDSQPPALMGPLSKAFDDIIGLKEANRWSPLFNHLSAIADGVVALGWIFESKPSDFLKEIFGGAKIYGNRVLSEYKGKDTIHTEFISLYYKIFNTILDYIQVNFPEGLTWNSDGVDVMEAISEVTPSAESGSKEKKTPDEHDEPHSEPATASPAAPPAAPPPPPLPTLDPASVDDEQKNDASGSANMSAMLGQLNQGLSITSTLRKVDDSEKIYKNPNLRTAKETPVQPSQPAGPAKKPKPENMRTKKSPLKELNGSKWFIENFDGVDKVEVDTMLNHSVLISNCNDVIFQINGKCNVVSVVNCNNVSILADTLISTLEAVRCTKFATQILHTVPVVSFAQVDEATVYLSEENLNCQLLTSKCSGICAYLPPDKDSEDGDMKEFALAEQIETTFKDGVMKSAPCEQPQ